MSRARRPTAVAESTTTATSVSDVSTVADVTELDIDRIQAARLWVAMKRPYYASALYRCPIIADPTTPTLAIDDRWRIYVNPAVAAKMTVTRLAAGLIHEINHVLRDHHQRAQTIEVSNQVEHERWNIAADAEINDDLHCDGLDIDLGSWVLPKSLGMPSGLMAEIYYVNLGGPFSRPNSCGSGAGGAKLPGELGDDETGGIDGDQPGVTEVEATMIRSQVANDVLAYQRAGVGTVPGYLVAWAHQQLEPIIDWRKVLAGEIRGSVATATDATDFSYQRFSRRASAMPEVRFAGRLRHVPEVAVVIDTSGSMSDGQISQVLAEVESILRSSGVAEDSLTFIAVDSAVSVCQRITQLPTASSFGRGGTDMTIGIAAALGQRPRPDVIFVLTDGYTPWPDAPVPGVRIMAGIIRPSGHFADNLPPEWITTIAIPFDD